MLWLDKRVLGLLLAVNLGGTIYGYMWYGSQLVDTFHNKPLWLLPFVPDSPTASLFFTLTLCWLLYDRLSQPNPITRNKVSLGRGVIEALALLTSYKYGIWAIAMIAAGAYQGDVIVWQQWMLIFSHLGMAVEALLYARFYRYGVFALLLASCWTLANDWIDYRMEVFPWLSRVLLDDLPQIQAFTILLSITAIVIGAYSLYKRKGQSF